MRKILLLLLMILLIYQLSISAQGIEAAISPSSISTKPGNKERFSLTVWNHGNKDIEINGIRLRITSKELFGIPIPIYLGEYAFPFDKPEPVGAGKQKVIERTIEIPLVPFAGSFDVEVLVETTGGVASTRMQVKLLYSWLSLAFLFVSLLIVIGIIYAILKLSFRRVRRRKIHKIDDLLSERDRYHKLLKELEAKRGKIGEKEYEALKEEYSSNLNRIQSELESRLPGLQDDLAKLEKEIEDITGEIRKIKARVEVKEVKEKEAEAEIRKKEKMLDERRKKADELRDLIRRIKGI
jgi:uncharacterized membrane protein